MRPMSNKTVFGVSNQTIVIQGATKQNECKEKVQLSGKDFRNTNIKEDEYQTIGNSYFKISTFLICQPIGTLFQENANSSRSPRTEITTQILD